MYSAASSPSLPSPYCLAPLPLLWGPALHWLNLVYPSDSITIQAAGEKEGGYSCHVVSMGDCSRTPWHPKPTDAQIPYVAQHSICI